jgi:hypothetical protein
MGVAGELLETTTGHIYILFHSIFNALPKRFWNG